MVINKGDLQHLRGEHYRRDIPRMRLKIVSVRKQTKTLREDGTILRQGPTKSVL